MTFELMSGNQAAATAVLKAGVDLIAAYPITPQTAIVEALANFAAKSQLKGEFVSVESEYSALSCCNGAAAAGARVFTATASHGLAYMHEMIHWCSGARLPVVMANVNRAIGAPWCLDPDQGDSLSQRDTGWVQIYCAGAQEVFDTILQAFVLAEEILLPCMVVFDGFYISHTYEVIDVPDNETVASFIGKPSFRGQVVPGSPANIHGLIPSESLHRHAERIHKDMISAGERFKKINDRFAAVFGRRYNCMETFIPRGAKNIIITAGAMAETIRWNLPGLPDTGLIQMRMFRPFPAEEIRVVIEELTIEKVIVIDRNCSAGAGGIIGQELKAALYGMERKPALVNLILAGGIDLTAEMLEKVSRLNVEKGTTSEKWGCDLS
ncbi:MAG: pyruvate ferredoxin oxidoreductase [Bacillota bacterium]